MTLYLLRHAEPVAKAESDASRTLTAKGIEQAKCVGRFCQKHGLVPDLIVSSPLRRAEQTARLVAEAMNGVEVRVAEFLDSGMQPESAIAELKNFAKFNKVMFVGHEPDFSALAARLLHAPDGRIRLSKASLTALQLNENHDTTGTLLFSIPANLMEP